LFLGVVFVFVFFFFVFIFRFDSTHVLFCLSVARCKCRHKVNGLNGPRKCPERGCSCQEHVSISSRAGMIA
jgi:hypothetical protein